MAKIFDKLCRPAEAAAILQLSERRTKELCEAGDINARKFGRDWVIELASVRKLAKARGLLS